MASIFDDANWRVLYTMDSISGTTLVDDIGSRNGTIYGGSKVASILGQGLSFNGGYNDRAAIPNHADLQITGDLTLSFWLYLRALPTVTASWTGMLSKFTNDANTEFNFRIKNATSGQFYYGTNPGNVLLNFTPSDIPLSKWTHIGAVKKIGSHIKLYVDGDIIAVLLDSEKPIIAGAATSSPVRIGTYDDNKYSLNAIFDQVRIGAFAATDAEMDTLASEPWPYEIGGVVTQDGAPLSTQVRLYDASTGELVEILNTDAAGVYQKILSSSAPLYAMAVPSSGYKPIAHGPINPALRTL